MEKGEVEQKGFDVSGVEAKPGNSQASVLTAHSQEGQTCEHPLPLPEPGWRHLFQQIASLLLNPFQGTIPKMEGVCSQTTENITHTQGIAAV